MSVCFPLSPGKAAGSRLTWDTGASEGFVEDIHSSSISIARSADGDVNGPSGGAGDGKYCSGQVLNSGGSLWVLHG